MSKESNDRFALRSALLFVVLATVVGCESKGPVQRAGASIDKGVQNAKDAINPPGPAEKAGRALDEAVKR
jgi:predicted small lipoprotein YifL